MVRLWQMFSYWVFEEWAGSQGDYPAALYWASRRKMLRDG
jgi:hypothetical protein